MLSSRYVQKTLVEYMRAMAIFRRMVSRIASTVPPRGTRENIRSSDGNTHTSIGMGQLQSDNLQ